MSFRSQLGRTSRASLTKAFRTTQVHTGLHACIECCQSCNAVDISTDVIVLPLWQSGHNVRRVLRTDEQPDRSYRNTYKGSLPVLCGRTALNKLMHTSTKALRLRAFMSCHAGKQHQSLPPRPLAAQATAHTAIIDCINPGVFCKVSTRQDFRGESPITLKRGGEVTGARCSSLYQGCDAATRRNFTLSHTPHSSQVRDRGVPSCQGLR
ncbi:hypothetical protein KC319_g31 [Hortaea werneckii]|nr:hypothetical protein KC319_g31 [Hortaea werneckii]